MEQMLYGNAGCAVFKDKIQPLGLAFEAPLSRLQWQFILIFLPEPLFQEASPPHCADLRIPHILPSVSNALPLLDILKFT